MYSVCFSIKLYCPEKRIILDIYSFCHLKVYSTQYPEKTFQNFISSLQEFTSEKISKDFGHLPKSIFSNLSGLSEKVRLLIKTKCRVCDIDLNSTLILNCINFHFNEQFTLVLLFLIFKFNENNEIYLIQNVKLEIITNVIYRQLPYKYHKKKTDKRCIKRCTS